MRYLIGVCILISVLMSGCSSGMGMHAKGEITFGTTDFRAEGEKTERVKHYKEENKLLIMKAKEDELEAISEKILNSRSKEKTSWSPFEALRNYSKGFADAMREKNEASKGGAKDVKW